MTNPIAFVRHDTLPEQAPPPSQRGVIKWMRENLFSSWLNAAMTVISLYVIYALLSAFLPWLLNGVWDASSLSECREKMDGVTGGCFAVLTERWNQLLFGFKYPVTEYWRIAVAFALLLVCAAPVLFQALPRKLLITTLLYPFVAYWLIWGGSLWVPMVILASLLLTTVLYQAISRHIGRILSTVLGLLVALIVAVLICYVLYLGGMAFWGMGNVFDFSSIGSSITYIALLALCGFVFLAMIPMALFVGYVIFDGAYKGDTGLLALFSALLFLGICLSMVLGPVASFINSYIPIELEAVPSRDLGGFMLNMILGVVCVSLSLPIGILLALGRQSRLPLIKGICVVFIEFIRGVPLITLLFVANVVLAFFLPPGTNFDLILRVIIMITLFSSAYIAEVIRGGLAALPKGQYEAGDSLGLNYAQSMRLIILPQALKISIPGIVNVSVGLFKDTTLVSVISMFDLVGMIRGPILASTEWNGVYWELFGFAIVLFFVVCYSISQYSQWLERQLATDHR